MSTTKITPPVKRGWSVAFPRKDGTQFLCCTHPGIARAIWGRRKDAVAYKNEAAKHNLKGRVVRVAYMDPVVMTKP